MYIRKYEREAIKENYDIILFPWVIMRTLHLKIVALVEVNFTDGLFDSYT